MSAATTGDDSGPFIWTNARVLFVDARVSAEAAASLLPSALRLAEPPIATLFVADYPETQFGSVYREAAVLLHAADEKGPALHCPWMVVDDDAALILGREMLGFPKKLADIRLEAPGDRVVGTVTRRGTTVMRLEATLREAEEHPEPFFGRRMVNAIGTFPTGMKLLELSPGRERIHSSRAADAEVTLASGDRDPLGDLHAVAAGHARYARLDFGAVGGSPPVVLGDADPDWVLRRFFPRAL